MRLAQDGLRISGWAGVGGEKRKRPGRRCGLSPARLPGLLEWTGPPLVECRALAFVSTCSHRPSRHAARRAMPRFGLDTGFPASNPSAPLHADPVARALGPGANRNRPRRVQLGWPQILRLLTTTPLPARHPKALCHPPPESGRSPAARRRRACPVVSPHRSPAAGFPVPVERSSRSPSPTSPEGGRGPGLTRRPPRSPETIADSSLLPSSRRSPTTRSEVAVNTVRAPIPLSLRERCGLGRSPLLTAPSACALRNEHQ